MDRQESGKRVPFLIQHCHLRPVQFHFRVVIHQIHLYPDGCILDNPCQRNHFPLVVPVRSIHVNSCVTRCITIRSFQFLHIILSQRQIRSKDCVSYFSILIYRRLRCRNQSSCLHDRLSSVILNILRSIQTKYRSCQSLSGFLILLFNRNLHLLAWIGIRSIPVNDRNFLPCIGYFNLSGDGILFT